MKNAVVHQIHLGMADKRKGVRMDGFARMNTKSKAASSDLTISAPGRNNDKT